MEAVEETGLAPAVPAAPPFVHAPPAVAPVHRVRFTATAAEYFRIWIVNMALTIVTLGVFSAWAKVRSKRYFYGHTTLDGDRFDYRGRPLAILKGRILAVAVTAAIYGGTSFAPMYAWALILPAALFGMPWLFVRAAAFNAHNSAWRGVRFRFGGTYWKCWRVMMGYGLFTVVTLGLGYFLLKARLTEFTVRHHAFGASGFGIPSLRKPFGQHYGRMIAMGLLGGVMLFGAGAALGRLGVRPEGPMLFAFNLASYVMYLGLFAYVRARVLNTTFNAASVGSVRFESTLGARKLYGIYLGNVIAILITLGLATPWAMVRTARYRAECLAVIAPEGLSGFAALGGGEIAAGGEEVGEMLDIDFGL